MILEISKLTKKIKYPDKWHLPACYWFWQHIPSSSEIDVKLKELKAGGFGSFQIAARLATPINDYLSDRFLTAYRYCADRARELKLMMGIYDDYNWQSGHAGGLCVKLDPSVKERHLFWSLKNIDDSDAYAELKISSISSGDAQCLFDIGKNWIYEGGKALWDEWEIVGVYNFTADGKKLAILDKTQFDCCCDDQGIKIKVKKEFLPYLNSESKLALFAAARCKSSRMVNYLLPQTAQAFIKTTYEPYAKALGDHLGTTVRYTFFDQPHSCFYHWRVNTSQVRSSLMFSKEFSDLLSAGGELEKAHCLISLLGDYFNDSAAKRCCVFETYAHLAFRNYFEPLRKWCSEHNLLFSGHEVLGHVHSWNFADTVITEDNRCNFALDYFALDALRDITAVDAKNSISQISAKMGDSVARANGRSGCILEQYYGRDEQGSHFGAGFWELKPLDLYAQVMRHHILGMRQFLMHAFYLDDGTLDNDEIFKNPRLDFAPGINFEPWYRPFFTKISIPRLFSFFAREVRAAGLMYNRDAEHNYRSPRDFKNFTRAGKGRLIYMDIKPFMKKRLMFAYEVSLPLMALFSLVTLIALGSSYFHPERQPLLIYLLDHAIWLVFTADLLVRLCFAKSLRAFVLSRLLTDGLQPDVLHL